MLAGPGPGTTAALGVSGLPFTVSVGDARRAAATIRASRTCPCRWTTRWSTPGPGGCFPGKHGSLVAEPRDGLTLLGAAQALSNDQVLRADNAAALLRLLGSGSRLVWYVPSIDDLVAGDGVSLTTLLPRWIRPGLWLAALAVAALILWRARRLGPLASEPLPVVVKAIETTRSRGRLYRRWGTAPTPPTPSAPPPAPGPGSGSGWGPVVTTRPSSVRSPSASGGPCRPWRRCSTGPARHRRPTTT